RQKFLHLGFVEFCDDRWIEIFECAPVALASFQYRRPAQAGLSSIENDGFEKLVFIVKRDSPLLVVIFLKVRICSCPRTPRNFCHHPVGTPSRSVLLGQVWKLRGWHLESMSSISVEAALAYAQKHGLEAVGVTQNGKSIVERYDNGFRAESVHALYSGTKSFWGPVAIRAERDGILALDEPVGESITEWGSDPAKRRITIRMLLSLTAGFGFGGLGAA